MKYSPSTNSFYPEDHPGTPEDAVEITDAVYEALFVAQGEGQIILAGPGGQPIAQTPTAPTPTLAQQAYAALYAGLTISLTGSITLAATLFPVDPAAYGKIALVATEINATGAFPCADTSWPMKDSAGNWHTLTVAQYKAIGSAIAAYAAPLNRIIDGDPTVTALPSSTVGPLTV